MEHGDDEDFVAVDAVEDAVWGEDDFAVATVSLRYDATELREVRQGLRRMDSYGVAEGRMADEAQRALQATESLCSLASPPRDLPRWRSSGLVDQQRLFRRLSDR